MSDFDELEVADYDLEELVKPVPASETLSYPDQAVQDDAPVDTLGRPGNSANTPSEALAKARLWHRERVNVGVGMCLSAVRQYYDVPAGIPTAAASYHMSAHKHGVTTGTLVPRGVPVYWTGGSSGAGHIAISVGGGICLSTDWKEAGKIDYAHIDTITSHWGLNFVGYTQEVNGVLVWRPAKIFGTVALHNLDYHDTNNDVLTVKKRLAAKGYRGFIKSSPRFGFGMRRAYTKYQTHLGYNGKDANGLPGPDSLKKLGLKVVP